MNDQSHDHALAQAVFLTLKERGHALDKNRVDTAQQQCQHQSTTQAKLNTILATLGVSAQATAQNSADPAHLPLIVRHRTLGVGRLVQFMGQNRWRFEQAGQVSTQNGDFVEIFALSQIHSDPKTALSFDQLLKQNLAKHKSVIGEAVIASLIINFLALAVSLFSMQVYDRVIPTNNTPTLTVLATGVALVIVLETVMKFARSKIMDPLVMGLDNNLARDIFERLLKVRIDTMPASVGSLAAQLRGYEQVRAFYTASTLFTLVDLPMSVIFIVIIAFIGSPWVAAVPLIAGVIGVLLGIQARKKIDTLAGLGAKDSYYKTGLLVETVEGMETLKAGAGGWKFLSRWINVMHKTTTNDLQLRHANDNLSYSIQMLQQVSYVSIVIIGSLVVMSHTSMTMGALIACSILGGRVLAPVMALPNLLVQYSHAKAAQKNIEQLFALPQDNQGVQPLMVSQVSGEYRCSDMQFCYQGNDRPAISLPNLHIRAGERVAVLGAIGSGKSTLLKLLSGLYAPSKGHILLDGLDITQIARESLSEEVGYLQQDHRLFQGTLRENLFIGMPPPDDAFLGQVLARTGLIRLVSSHSKGLDLPISEGGKGLSGGQKQLVAFTRLVLTQPSVWLLDEPTASMDNVQEQQCLQALAQELADPRKTLVVSTHKMALLELATRIIVMQDGQIVMDGPKQAVLDHLAKNSQR